MATKDTIDQLRGGVLANHVKDLEARMTAAESRITALENGGGMGGALISVIDNAGAQVIDSVGDVVL